jgi:hypothetical protein
VPVTKIHAVDNGRAFTPRATIDTIAEGGRLSFASIFPAGLMARWIDRGWATASWELGPDAAYWHGTSALIEDAWNHLADRPIGNGASRGAADLVAVVDRFQQTVAYVQDQYARADRSPPAPPLHVLRAFGVDAIAAGVLSVSQQFEAASSYLRRTAGSIAAAISGDPSASETVRLIELDRVKEGHTSAVFRVRVYGAGPERPVVFGLNVARDTSVAADNLLANAAALSRWSIEQPPQIAAILDVGAGRCRWFGRDVEVPITAVSWLADMHELHAIRSSEPPAAALVLVAQFVQRDGPLPAIRSIRLTARQRSACWARVVALRTALLEVDRGADALTPANVDINHGDVVARLRGDEIDVALIAAAPTPWRGPAAVWPFEVALSRARDQAAARHRYLFWSEPQIAVRAMTDALMARGTPDACELCRTIVTAAAAADLDWIRRALGPPAQSEYAAEILRRARQELRRAAR